MKAYLFAGAAIALLTHPAQAQMLSLHSQRMSVKQKNLLYVNGQPTGGNVAPRRLGTVLYVPFRFVTVCLGGSAAWDIPRQTAKLKVGDKDMIFVAGKNQVLVNNEKYPLNAPMRLIDGRVMIPLRDVAHLLDAKAAYDKSSGAVYLITSARTSR